MADLNDAPSDSERSDLEARVHAAADAGRISTADRDIRLGNVHSAQSRAELELMGRDLDQLDASAASPGTAAPYSTFEPGDAGNGSTDGASGSPRRVIVVVAVVVVVLGLVAALVAVIARHGSSSGSSTLPPAQTSPSGTGGSSPGSTPSAGPGKTGDYSLSAAGIRGFLATYRKQFGTPRVVDLVMYPAYAVVDVPVPGGRGRQQSWLYRPGSGWISAGGVRAVFPGAGTVNTRRLDVDALARNIKRAEATLKVENPTTTYVIVRFIRRIDPVPSVDIHVANDFQESGYLATTLAGKVQRAYPFAG